MTDETPNPSVELTTYGVGPWRGDKPEGDHWDPELLERGDSRNVIDRYRYWTMAAIVADLDEHRHGFHVADRKSTRLNSSHRLLSRMPSSA